MDIFDLIEYWEKKKSLTIKALSKIVEDDSLSLAETLKAQISSKIVADDNLFIFFYYYFTQKINLGISYESFALFSLKKY